MVDLSKTVDFWICFVGMFLLFDNVFKRRPHKMTWRPTLHCGCNLVKFKESIVRFYRVSILSGFSLQERFQAQIWAEKSSELSLTPVFKQWYPLALWRRGATKFTPQTPWFSLAYGLILSKSKLNEHEDFACWTVRPTAFPVEESKSDCFWVKPVLRTGWGEGGKLMQSVNCFSKSPLGLGGLLGSDNWSEDYCRDLLRTV